jgi:hypothetical protein
VVFGRKQSGPKDTREAAQAALVDKLLNSDELERRQLLLAALQSGELKKSEAADLLRLVDRLASVASHDD